MSGGGISSMMGQIQPAQPQMNWQTGQPVAQPAPAAPAYQSMGPTGWGPRPQFSTSSVGPSAAQQWWLGQGGADVTNAINQKAQADFKASQAPIDRNKFFTTQTDGEGNSYSAFDQTGYDKAVATQKAQQYTPLSNQEAMNANLRQGIQDRMGNYGGMISNANQYGVSQADIQNAIGGNTDMYTYMNRPNYQQYSPNGQFNPTIYQSNYQNYNTGNPMAISQYGQGPDYYGMGLGQMMNTPFNPYANAPQTPFSAQQPIVSRSASMRGTPNVIARRAEGGIASLMDKE